MHATVPFGFAAHRISSRPTDHPVALNVPSLGRAVRLSNCRRFDYHRCHEQAAIRDAAGTSRKRCRRVPLRVGASARFCSPPEGAGGRTKTVFRRRSANTQPNYQGPSTKRRQPRSSTNVWCVEIRQAQPGGMTPRRDVVIHRGLVGLVPAPQPPHMHSTRLVWGTNL